MTTRYAIFWKGKRIKEWGTFKTKAQADTVAGIETTQMEFAEYTPSQLHRYLKVRKVRK